VHEQGRLSGTIHGSHDFLGDNGTFANACENGATFLLQEQRNNGRKLIVDKLGQVLQRL
jgi:hypothetical protein